VKEEEEKEEEEEEEEEEGEEEGSSLLEGLINMGCRLSTRSCRIWSVIRTSTRGLYGR
jgi:hypothetical protein